MNGHRIDVFVDVHSYSELVLYPWGHALNQTTNPAQNFTTLASGTCAPLNPPTYKEYIPATDLTRFQTVARRVVDSVHAVRGRTYTPEPVHSVYSSGTSGTSSDYVYSRHRANPALHKTYGFAFETGNSTGNYREDFHPSDPTRLASIKQEAKTAILTLIQQSICAIEFVGEHLSVTAAKSDKFSTVEALRNVRDDTLGTTEAGQAWIDLFERLQAPALGVVLADETLKAEAVALFERAAELVASDAQALRPRRHQARTCLPPARLASHRRPRPAGDDRGRPEAAGDARRRVGTEHRRSADARGPARASPPALGGSPPAAQQARRVSAPSCSFSP